MIKYGCQISEQEGNNAMKATTTVSEQGISPYLLLRSATLQRCIRTLLVSMVMCLLVMVTLTEQAHALEISEQANYEASIAKGCTEANMFEDYSCKGPEYIGYVGISEQGIGGYDTTSV
jgi:hypothetical protein